MAYSGSCHCGAVTFTVDADAPTGAMSCNCSHCRRKGFLLSFVPAELVTIERGADTLASYTFNKHQIVHRFCPTCGTQPLAEGEMKGAKMRGINLRCVPNIDLDGLQIEHVDGASL